MVDGSWAPANETEKAMAEALRHGDAQRYLDILVHAPLYLPAFDESGAQRLVTFREGDQTYLLVFTSGEAMARQLTGVPAFRTTSHGELVEKWPDPAWLLAVDPGLPIGALLPPTAASQAADGVVPVVPAEQDGTEPAVAVDPDNELERAILAALAADDMDTLAQVLILAEVQLPTTRPVARPVRLEAGFPWHHVATQPPTVAVFTSPELLDRALPHGVDRVAVPLLDIALAWPDLGWRLAVNPGWAAGFTLPGELVRGLVGRAAALVAEAERAPEPPRSVATRPQAPPDALVKVLPADQVEWYLQGNWQQVTGRVFPWSMVEAARTPAALHAVLGGYLPFRPDDPTVHLIRWGGRCPALYRQRPDGSLQARAVALPHDARLYRLDAGGDEAWLARFDADAGHWVPAPDAVTPPRAAALNGYLARWRGRDYEASPDGTRLRLYRSDPAPGFEPVGPDRYRCLVPAAEAEWFGYRRTVADLRGERVVLLAEDGEAGLVEWDGVAGRPPDWWPGGSAEPGVHWARVNRADLSGPREERLREP